MCIFGHNQDSTLGSCWTCSGTRSGQEPMSPEVCKYIIEFQADSEYNTTADGFSVAIADSRELIPDGR